jgi:large subunit ribosomal protein L21
MFKVEDTFMYAIVQSGGRQYQVQPGSIVRLEKLPGEVGQTVTLDQVLLVADGDQVQVGQPILQNMAIQARIVEQARHSKVVIFKHKRRKDYRKKQGHRQFYTAVLVEGIGQQGQESAAAAAPETESRAEA